MCTARCYVDGITVQLVTCGYGPRCYFTEVRVLRGTLFPFRVTFQTLISCSTTSSAFLFLHMTCTCTCTCRFLDSHHFVPPLPTGAICPPLACCMYMCMYYYVHAVYPAE